MACSLARWLAFFVLALQRARQHPGAGEGAAGRSVRGHRQAVGAIGRYDPVARPGESAEPDSHGGRRDEGSGGHQGGAASAGGGAVGRNRTEKRGFEGCAIIRTTTAVLLLLYALPACILSCLYILKAVLFCCMCIL